MTGVSCWGGYLEVEIFDGGVGRGVYFLLVWLFVFLMGVLYYSWRGVYCG